MKKVLLFVLATIALIAVQAVNEEILAQDGEHSVSGIVTDAETGDPLPGVNITVRGTSNGTSTDTNGEYSLTVSNSADSLSFSFIGFQNQVIPIEGRSEIDVELFSQALTGEEVVVVGYGTQQKKNLTGSVKQLSGDELAKQASVQTSSSLMGKIPGMQVVQTSGQPGQNQAGLKIRGIGTLGNADPLILIDGVEGNINDVSSYDIESISVLKDASAAAVYGSRAANGVVLVTTKRGSVGDMQVNYRGFLGKQEPTRQPDFVEGKRFMELENLGATNLGKQPIWSENYIQEYEQNYRNDPDNYPNTDWIDAVFTEPGLQQKHNLRISGGNEMARYMGSLNYDEQNGNIPNYSFKKYSIRLNTDVTVSEKLDFRADLRVQRNDRVAPSASLNDITRKVYRTPPVYAGVYTHGGWGPAWNGQNPIAYARDGGLDKDEISKVKGRINATYHPHETFEINIMYSPKYRAAFSKNMTKQFEIADPNTGESVQTVPNRNSLSESYNRNFENTINLTADYQQDLESHSVNLLGGYEFINFRTDYFNAYRDDFPLQNFEQLNAGSEENMQNSGSAANWALQSFFGRASYDYQDKYLLEANLRYDGSSRFTEDKRWGLFPSFSAGWVISEESFMDSFDFINNLKLRGSWGILGNQQIGNYPFASVINLGTNYIFGGNSALGGAQLTLANKDITWEETTSSNIGMDLTLLEDRLNFTFDYFNRTTSDILLRLPTSMLIGQNSPYQNAGEVKNTGWEFEAGYRGGIGNEFNYNIDFNISDVTSEVTDLKGTGPYISGNSIIREGDPINSIYGYESDGLFNTQQEIDEHADQPGNIAPGDIRYVDQNDDGLINAEDRVIIGDSYPTLNFGIDLSANYKNFDISAFFQGIGDRDILLRQDAVWALYNGGKIRTWQAEDYWTPENTDASYPRLTQTGNHNNFRSTDYWVYDASYLRLRTLQVGYNLPTSLLGNLSINNARVFFLGQNLFTVLDGMPEGVDPHIPNNNNGSYYPITRLMSVGIDISL